jgi:hypothetical protein
MLLGNFGSHSSTESGSFLRRDRGPAGANKPGDGAFQLRQGPPAPAEIFIEMGLVVAAALGLAVVVGLAV